MTRTLPNLLVVLAVLSAASLLNAQECDCRKLVQTPNGELSYVTGFTPLAPGTLATCLSEDCADCPQCNQTTCPECPSCVEQCVCLNTRVNAACTMNPQFSEQPVNGAHPRLPGSTSFIDDQSRLAAEQRAQMARQIVDYLISQDHDPAHVQEVIQGALESSADSAHRQAMMSLHQNNQPLAAAPSRAFPSDPSNPLVAPERDFARLPAAAGQSLPVPVAQRRPSEPVIDPVRKNEMDFRQVQREQVAMQEMIVTIKKDMQRMAENLSQLHVESRMNGPHTPTKTWPSTAADVLTQPKTPQRDHYVATLEQEITSLRRQIQAMQARSSMKHSGNRVAQADFEQAMRLQPRHSSTMPLTPAETASVTVKYYVGDLMEPPFHTATLRLMQFLKANVDPASWKDSHMIQITEPSISLTITQSRTNHERIADLLQQVRTGSRSYLNETIRR